MAREYHVSKTGSDKNIGTAEAPFLTISHAAKLADEGDVVIVHEGEYREWVSPERGARNELGRITYTAAEGEYPVIKGSEVLSGWIQKEDGVWTAKVKNTIFGEYHPYTTEVNGDWMIKPLDPPCHTGRVYLDGDGLMEAPSYQHMLETPMTWFAEVSEEETTFFANFGEKNPTEALVEILVRKCCFYPEKTGLNYITVKGFEMAQAATPWAPPTTEQFGMLGTHWSKGWIIEDNIFHDARCSAVSVGKELSTGDNVSSRYQRKPGYQTQLETVFAAKRIGWDKENIGSHIIRNNTIYNCGQNGIVGNLGGAFSEIYGNHIHHIGSRREYFGYEIAGIKLHAAIDTQIHHNHIHHCSMGTWLDWQAQGTRLSKNLYHHNVKDLWIEVTHGPHLVDNNIFGSPLNFLNAAQGGAYVHNLFCGGTFLYDVLDRSTPYHYAHSTDIKGTAVVYSADDRFYNNIFLNTMKEKNEQFISGTVMYNGSTDSLENYIENVAKRGKGDVELFLAERQPMYMAHNYYADGAEAYDLDKDSICSEVPSGVNIIEEDDGVYLEITLDSTFETMDAELITTSMLGMPRIVEELYENPDGSPICVDADLLDQKRDICPTVGPIEGLKAGTCRVKLL